MQGFLHDVAHDLYVRYGESLAQRAILFPSRRARLFFVDALSQEVAQPMWQPQWVTIDDLMGEISGLTIGDRLRLITELYKIYSQYHNEAFDKFYFWGDLLLNDFDTIDKYRIDADQLFSNIVDLKVLESDLSYLTPEQMQIIVHFWSTLDDGADLSQEKQRFLEIWKTLAPIYHRFHERLQRLGIAYNGMMQRAAADRIKAGEYAFPEPRKYIVAGFNALSECEKILFRFLSTAAETDFYWDYDSYYKDHAEQEAGLFVRENMVLFPACTDLPHDHMQNPKSVTAVAAASNAIQCKHVASILRELSAQAKLDKDTAIVLTDENLLLPVLYALPPETGKVNVTMGYPLKQSLAYTFVERLVELQAHCRPKGAGFTFYHADVTGLLAHPYVADSDPELTRKIADKIIAERRITVESRYLAQSDLLALLFSATADWQALSNWLAAVIAEVARLPYAGDDARQRIEYLAVIAEEIHKLENSLAACDVTLTPEIYASLLRRHLQTLRIPFEGEPLEGIQVMGILETRNLDFRNVIILSMNDDNFPGNHTSQPSFIPYNLRAAYQMPTPEHHEGVYAYYFYRLIQRAERVWMLYCSHADEKSTGEPSRYIYQLDYESGFDVRKIEVGVDVNLAETAPIEVAKDTHVMQQLARFTDPESKATLSPTAFYRYVACPLRFYFHSVARLETDDQISEEVDAPMFGTILHDAAEQLYAQIRQEQHPAQVLNALIRSDKVEKAVEQAINKNYLQDPTATTADYTGNLLLVKDIVIRYLKEVLAYDAAHDAFRVTDLEEAVSCNFEFEAEGVLRSLKFAGYADRIDKLDDGLLRVVDYKTGSPHLDFSGLDDLFHGKAKNRQSNVLQTLIYSMILARTRNADAIPTLYYVRAMHQADYEPTLYDRALNRRGVPYSDYAEPFEALLRETLAEMFDSSVPFRQCEDVDTCAYCDFNGICKR